MLVYGVLLKLQNMVALTYDEEHMLSARYVFAERPIYAMPSELELP